MTACQVVSLKFLWLPLRSLSGPWASHILLGWEPTSQEVKANSRLLNRALCRFKYTIMSPCFSTISSRLEIVLQRIKILMMTYIPRYLLVSLRMGPYQFSVEHIYLLLFLRCYKPRHYSKMGLASPQLKGSKQIKHNFKCTHAKL